MIDVEGDQGQDQDQEIEDTGIDRDHDQDQETDTTEDHPIAATDAEVIVLELVHHPEDEEVENALEVEAEVAIDIIEEVEDNLKTFLSACKKQQKIPDLLFIRQNLT